MSSGLVAVAPYATGRARERECRSRMPTLEGVFFSKDRYVRKQEKRRARFAPTHGGGDGSSTSIL